MARKRPDDKLATVFGATGFIGRYVVRELARAGWRVRAPTRHPEGARFLRPMGVVGQVSPVLANIRNRASVESAVEDADLVVNLVAVLAERGRNRFRSVNVEGAATVAEAARAAGAATLIHISAIGADPQSPSAYGRSKAAGEAAVRETFPEATILRPSIVFGPEDHFFNRFAAMARLSLALPLVGAATRFQPVHVGDVADAAMAAVTDRAARGRTFELGGPGIHTFRELMALMLEVIGRRRLLVPLPFWAGHLLAIATAPWPGTPPITRDQVRQLGVDNVVAEGAAGLSDLGITPTPVEMILPTYLDRFRVGGPFMPQREPGR